MTVDVYTHDYLTRQRGHSYRSAEKILPLIVRFFEPQSVVDVGCGIGAWLSVLAELGVHDVDGYDGDYVSRDALLIPSERFHAAELREPLLAGRRYDLALSLEVAEHLPATSAPSLIDSLCDLAPVILFSAAIPGQGGRSHINERPQSYWSELFEKRGFRPVDMIRPVVWRDPAVAWWYAQNALVYVSGDGLVLHPKLIAFLDQPLILDIVHPDMVARSLTTPAVAAQLRRSLQNSIRLRAERVLAKWRTSATDR